MASNRSGYFKLPYWRDPTEIERDRDSPNTAHSSSILYSPGTRNVNEEVMKMTPSHVLSLIAQSLQVASASAQEAANKNLPAEPSQPSEPKDVMIINDCCFMTLRLS